MNIFIQHKYLTLPINNDASMKKLCLWENGRLLFDMNCRIDLLSPTQTAYIDVTRFMGRTLTLTVSPEMELRVGVADSKELEGLWKEPLRPRVHYTVSSGYNNDPNGLIYHKGVYHMFYQHNPCANQWGNMHWGHAVGTDLIHWEETDCALYPDELGAMFSGCAIEDVHNCSGLGENGNAPILLFYTAAGGEHQLSEGKKFTQCLAYSHDGGKSFIKYAGNPIIDHVVDANRDPKVVWVEEIKRFIMALYLTEDIYQLYSSSDLIHWTVFQKIHLTNDKECPDLYSLSCDGEKKWVLSGGSDCYLVGHFTKEAFAVDSPPRKLTYSMVSYAGQTFSGVENGRVVRLWWDRNRTSFFDYRFSQQMGIPIEMSLAKVNGKYYLGALPVSELSCLYRESISHRNVMLQEPLRISVGENPLDITVKLPYLEDARFTLRIYGAVLTVDTLRNSITFGHLKMPISLLGDGIKVRIVVDRCSIEVFADDGKFCMTAWHVSDFNLPYVELACSQKVQLEELTCHILSSIHD